jgi:hypothetical protein
MIQKDYIMRIIEQLAKVLAKVMLNKNEKNYEEAISNVENAFNTILGVNSQLLFSISEENLTGLFGISRDKSIGSIKCIVAARLVKELADVHEMTQKENINAISEYQKALNLYLDGLLNLGYHEIDLNEYYSDVHKLTNKLGTSVEETTKQKLIEYDEMVRRKQIG